MHGCKVLYTCFQQNKQGVGRWRLTECKGQGRMRSGRWATHDSQCWARCVSISVSFPSLWQHELGCLCGGGKNSSPNTVLKHSTKHEQLHQRQHFQAEHPQNGENTVNDCLREVQFKWPPRNSEAEAALQGSCPQVEPCTCLFNSSISSLFHSMALIHFVHWGRIPLRKRMWLCH